MMEKRRRCWRVKDNGNAFEWDYLMTLCYESSMQRMDSLDIHLRDCGWDSAFGEIGCLEP